MAVPIINDVTPNSGLSGGGELVRIHGNDFADDVIVLFGEAKAAVISVLKNSDQRTITCHSPSHIPSTVDIIVKNLDAEGKPISNEVVILTEGFRFHRPSIAKESDLTRLVRTILRELKKQLIENTSISVSLDYNSTPEDGPNIIELAKLPSILISGPNLSENRFYSTNEFREELVSLGDVPEVVRWRSPFTTDLSFSLTCASDNPAELLNLISEVSRFLYRNCWLVMQRDPDDASKGSVKWELAPQGDIRTNFNGQDDVSAFTWGFVVRGFDVDEGQPLDIGYLVTDPKLQTERKPQEGEEDDLLN